MRAFILVVALVVSAQLAHGAEKVNNTIVLTIPEPILVDAVRKSLPVVLNTGSESLDGSIAIEQIDNLQLSEEQLSALVTVVGNDIQIKTTIAGQQLRLNVGTVQLTFNMAAATRYEAPTQTLFIKPTVTDLKTEQGQAGDELGTLLVGLFNGKEFPLSIDKLQPIITDTGTKKLELGLQIEDILISENMLRLHLLPKIKPLTKQ